MMSIATLFFFIFFPSYRVDQSRVSTWRQTWGWATHLDESSSRLEQRGTHKHDDPLTLVLVLSVLQRKLSQPHQPYVPTRIQPWDPRENLPERPGSQC